MKGFKEWLSDNLRYLLLILLALVIAGGCGLGLYIYDVVTAPDISEVGQAVNESDRQTEPETLLGTPGETRKETEEKTETEKLTEKKTETDTEKVTETPEETQTETEKGETTPTETEKSEKETEKAADGQNSGTFLEQNGITQVYTRKETEETEKATQKETQKATQPTTEAPQPATQAPTEPPTEAPVETEPPTEAVYTPVYRTLNHTCYLRSYADYGDNIIAELGEGTVVELLEDGGWAKVQVDGMVGYVGGKFLQ